MLCVSAVLARQVLADVLHAWIQRFQTQNSASDYNLRVCNLTIPQPTAELFYPYDISLSRPFDLSYFPEYKSPLFTLKFKGKNGVATYN